MNRSGLAILAMQELQRNILYPLFGNYFNLSREDLIQIKKIKEEFQNIKITFDVVGSLIEKSKSSNTSWGRD